MGKKVNGYTVRERERRLASPPDGHRQSWTEWQVVSGRKVVSRHDFREQAVKWIARHPITEFTAGQSR